MLYRECFTYDSSYTTTTCLFQNISKYLFQIPLGERKSRISHSLLTRPKRLGGIGLPDLLNYHTAAHLTRIVDCNVHSLQKDWVSLLASFTNLRLDSLPWVSPRHIPQTIKCHPLIGPTLECFRKTCHKTSISSIPGPLTPVKLNLDFPLGMHNHFLTDNWPHEQMRAYHFFHQNELLPVSQLTTQLEKPPISPWTHLLLVQFLKSLNKDLQCSRWLTPFEKLCIQKTPQSHLISVTHDLIFTDILAHESPACKLWEKDLDISISSENWEQIFLNIHKGSTNVTTQEN